MSSCTPQLGNCNTILTLHFDDKQLSTDSKQEPTELEKYKGLSDMQRYEGELGKLCAL